MRDVYLRDGIAGLLIWSASECGVPDADHLPSLHEENLHNINITRTTCCKDTKSSPCSQLIFCKEYRLIQYINSIVSCISSGNFILQI